MEGEHQYMTITTVLFDFDGVVADTEMGTSVYLQKAFAQYGIELTDDQKKSYIGTDGRKQTEKILKEYGKDISVEEFFEVRKKLGSYYENSPLLKPISGLQELFDYLRMKELGIGLVSSTNSKLIITALNRMNLVHYFDTIICGDMVKCKKPDPEGYLMAMQYLHVSPEACIIVEDSPTGIQAGLNAGALVAGFKGSEIKQDTSEANITWESYRDAIAQMKELLTGEHNE